MILTNSTDIDFNQINGQIADITNAAYKKPLIPGNAKYAGTYKLPGGYGSMTIVLKNDALYSTYCQEILQGRPMLADGEPRFRVEDKEGHRISYEFVADENGKFTRLRMGQLLWYRE